MLTRVRSAWLSREYARVKSSDPRREWRLAKSRVPHPVNRSPRNPCAPRIRAYRTHLHPTNGPKRRSARGPTRLSQRQSVSLGTPRCAGHDDFVPRGTHESGAKDEIDGQAAQNGETKGRGSHRARPLRVARNDPQLKWCRVNAAHLLDREAG